MNTTLPLNQHDLLRWRACARRFWLRRQPATDGAAPDEAALPDAGQATAALADAAQVAGPGVAAALRACYPGALALPAPGSAAEWAAAVQRTTDWLAAGPSAVAGATLFGACLASDDGARVRIDVLTRGTAGLQLFKLRLATVGDEADADTVALWLHVASRAGLRVQQAGLLLVDTDFSYPGFGCYAGLLREFDLRPLLGGRPVAQWLLAMRCCERRPEPAADPGEQCHEHPACEFAGHCQAAPGAPARAAEAAADASLQWLGRELAAELRAEGHADLRSVPPQRLADPRHRRVQRAVLQAAPQLEPAVAGVVQALPWPRHLLRFDTIGFAVPVWPGTRPYQVLPFQWTCDRLQRDGRLTLQAHLAGAGGLPDWLDPRRGFAEALLAALGTEGPVLAYNAGFERNRIRDLAAQLDDLAGPLLALLPRLVDLYQITRAHYYHPAMAGSWSFRALAAVLAEAPQRSALAELAETRAMAVPGPCSVQAVFARSLQPGLPPTTRQALQQALLRHGRQQTAVLRRLLALFEGAADPR